MAAVNGAKARESHIIAPVNDETGLKNSIMAEGNGIIAQVFG